MWTSWSGWSVCSKACGGGVYLRERTCPMNQKCLGVGRQEMYCNEKPCPRPGNRLNLFMQFTTNINKETKLSYRVVLIPLKIYATYGFSKLIHHLSQH